ncbi:restriction endonuclease subunit S [Cerasicoccus fimbriatus]|uniref:restriction endonuclease subunit S n=1 Tax=Cerasicoccus fimbriatus TaxID=3014554 RepID=UPI0022B589A2|nr:restriction endonuclease subunit S [Cerasicoccus sp. TK19100]
MKSKSIKLVALKEHAKFLRGLTFKPTDKVDFLSPDSVACMRTKNVQAELDESDIIAIPKRLVKNSEKLLCEGDILVSSANSWNLVGKCCWVPKLSYESTAGGFISVLRPKDEKLNKRYLYQWFSSEVIQHQVRSFGNQTTNISNLDHKRTLNLEIPLPPLEEQKRIAKILDAADGLRQQRREALTELDTFLQSTFLDLFGDPVTNPKGWDVISFDKIGKFISGATPSKQRADFWDGEFPWVSPKDMKVNRIVDSIDHISDSAFKETNLKRISPSHVLIVVRGMILAHSFPVAVNEVEIAINQDMKAISPDESFDTIFLSECIRGLKTKILSEVSTAGHGTKRFDAIAMAKINVPVPPLDLQQHFAKIVTKVEEQKTRMREQLTELDDLFAALQQRAFNGEL